MNNGTLHTCSLNNELYKSIGQIIDVEQHEQITSYPSHTLKNVGAHRNDTYEFTYSIPTMTPHSLPQSGEVKITNHHQNLETNPHCQPSSDLQNQTWIASQNKYSHIPIRNICNPSISSTGATFHNYQEILNYPTSSTGGTIHNYHEIPMLSLKAFHPTSFPPHGKFKPQEAVNPHYSNTRKYNRRSHEPKTIMPEPKSNIPTLPRIPENIPELPQLIQPFVEMIYDVRGDGHCGYRAISACLGRCEPVPLEWQQDTRIGCKVCVFLRRKNKTIQG